MDDEDGSSRYLTATTATVDESTSAVNSLILEYYKKFGRKRDLEQYFSLSTAQSDLRDPSGSFWRKMKSENDSSDSGERKSDSSQEVCRISIRCSTLPEPSSTKDFDDNLKAESVSPPIIIEEVPQDNNEILFTHNKTYSDDDSVKSEDNQSQKSYDILDTSTNKPLSPSSSITSQRKLEWDSLADVGYGNESDRKTSASSLSTLEKLALKQQYSNNDTGSNLGLPTAHSTPLEENDLKSKNKKGVGKKSTKIYKKDVDLVEVNVPHSSNNNPPQSINVNLTKHISFNVEKDGKVTVENILKDVSVSPDKKSIEATVSPVSRVDREIQTSLIRTKEADSSPEIPKNIPNDAQKIPIMISLNTLKKRVRRKRLRKAKRKIKSIKSTVKENVSVLDKSGEQLSEAESFEYMPGHIYNQNHLQANAAPPNMAGNKSSLESSGALTTDSSKGSKHSFSKDLKKSIEVLRNALRDRCDDAALRKQLIKQVCEKLLNTKYRDDNSSSDFLSGLSFSSRKLGLRERNQTTTSTSDNNDSGDKIKPKKSILRNDKFNAGVIASTSQSAPNLPVASTSERPVASKLVKPLINSNTDSELSSKEKHSSDNIYAKTSSEELYKKYLEALHREQAYKRHLKDKEMLLKQKLVCSDSAFSVPVRPDTKVNERLKDLLKDLTRNNYADGSGDASNLEGGPNSNTDFNRIMPVRSQRSHSVFTLSSGNSETRKPNLKKRLQCDIKDDNKPSTSKDKHYCCCPHHSNNLNYGVTDSAVQVNIRLPYSSDTSPEPSIRPRDLSPKGTRRAESPTCRKPETHGDVKYLCLCNNKVIKDVPDNFFLYKCSRVSQNDDSSKSGSLQSNHDDILPRSAQNEPSTSKRQDEVICAPVLQNSKSSQANLLTKLLRRKSNDLCLNTKIQRTESPRLSKPIVIFEATRCLQTEISIDPKIPEPSLSDICIISDSHCATLVSENCREISKTTVSGSNQETQSGSGSHSNTVSSKSTGTSKKFAENFALEDFDSHSKFNEQESENYTIPIQGTNMTLMVSIGSKDRKTSSLENNTPTTMISEYAGTEKALQIDQGTSLTEECSKGVQYNAVNVAKSIDTNDTYSTHKSTADKNGTEDSKTNTYKDSKSNTYPKSPVNERKPLLRSNTDTNNLATFNIKPDLNDKKSIKTNSTNQSKNFTGYIQKSSDNKYESAKNKTSSVSSPRTASKSSSPVNKSRRSSIASAKCDCGCIVKDCNNQCKTSNNSCKSTKCAVDKQSKNDEEKRDESPKRNPVKEVTVNEASQFNEQNDNTEIITLNIKENTDNKCKKTGDSQSCQTSPRNFNTCVCGCTDKDCNNKCSSNYVQGDCTKFKDVKIVDPVKETASIGIQCVCGCDVKGCNKCSETNEIIGDCKGNKTHCPNTNDAATSTTEINQNDNKTDSAPKSVETDKSVLQIGKESVSSNGQHKNANKETVSPRIAPSNGSRPSSGSQNSTEQASEVSDKKYSNKFKAPLRSKDGFSSKSDSDTPKGEKESSSQHANSPKRKKEIGVQKNQSRDASRSPSRKSNGPSNKNSTTKINLNKACQSDSIKNTEKPRSSKLIENVPSGSESETYSDPIIEMIQSITKRYSKGDIEKSKRKKCFKEIVNVLNYLLETDTPSDDKENIKKPRDTSSTPISDICPNSSEENAPSEKPKKLIDKGVQMCPKKCKSRNNCEFSSDLPGTSTDSATCKVLNKIRKECERYHQKRCQKHGKKCEMSSSTSVNCNMCRKTHYCHCRHHKCKINKKCSEISKKPVAYNLIIQTSDSLMSEEPSRHSRQLKNIIVKVPSKKKGLESMPFKELEAKIEGNVPKTTQINDSRPKTIPNESEFSSFDEMLRKTDNCTVREYLEKNRPDFVENCSQRQNCLKFISGSRANERAVKRDLLSMRVAQLSNVTELHTQELLDLARDIGRHIRSKRPTQKLISEREMKKHSEKIYKKLPEVVRKKEEEKKENEKKTNLLMASMFKKNLQKKTLRGSVNLSNYSTVIKI